MEVISKNPRPFSRRITVASNFPSPWIRRQISPSSCFPSFSTLHAWSSVTNTAEGFLGNTGEITVRHIVGLYDRIAVNSRHRNNTRREYMARYVGACALYCFCVRLVTVADSKDKHRSAAVNIIS